MTNDDWLREKGRARKLHDEERRRQGETRNATEKRRKRIFSEQIDQLWSALQAELKRLVAIYNEEARDSNALYVENHPYLIDIRSPDGEHLSLSLNRSGQYLYETRRLRTGGTSAGSPMFNFSFSDDDRLSFSVGTPSDAARMLLRRVLD